jgi:prophage antirepressor-like protein
MATILDHGMEPLLAVFPDGQTKEAYRLPDVLVLLEMDPTALTQCSLRKGIDYTQSAGETVVAESGVIHLALQSDSQFGQRIQEWLCRKVLPDLLIKGEYISTTTDVNLPEEK